MNDIMTWIGIISLGSLLMGLLFYSFYIVLVSKDENYRTNDNPASVSRSKKSPDINRGSAPIPGPGDFPGHQKNNKRRPKRAA